MFKIETWVGLKYGGWFAGTDRYHTEGGAQDVIAVMELHERRAKATRMKRRVVPC